MKNPRSLVATVRAMRWDWVLGLPACYFVLPVPPLWIIITCVVVTIGVNYYRSGR